MPHIKLQLKPTLIKNALARATETDRFYLGIDNGGTLSKAALYDQNGRELSQAARKTTLLIPQPGWTERSMAEMWQATAAVIREVIEKSGIKPGTIAAVAATGHGNGLYLIDQDGQPSRNGIISTDSRALQQVKHWEQNGVLDTILPKTMQSVWAGSTVALLAWLAQNEPDTVQRCTHILLAKDYTRYCLTGEIASDFTDMSGTNLLNVRDACYDPDLLAVLGISWAMAKLPALRKSTEICGHISAAAATATGLAVGTPVAGGLFDIDAAAIATGTIDDTTLSVVAGTWSINQYISRNPVVKKGLFMTSLYCLEDWWLICEGSPTSASNLEWFVTQLIQAPEANDSPSQSDVFEYVETLVSGTSNNDDAIVFLPFIFGSNVVEDARSAFVGISSWHTKAHLLRAIHEGIVFGHRSHIERLGSREILPGTVRIAGGATKSRFWMQMFADILQMPVEVTTSTELGALGAALCARVACGDAPSLESAATTMVQVADRYEPDPRQKDIYDQKYIRYTATIQVLAPLWKRWT